MNWFLTLSWLASGATAIYGASLAHVYRGEAKAAAASAARSRDEARKLAAEMRRLRHEVIATTGESAPDAAAVVDMEEAVARLRATHSTRRTRPFAEIAPQASAGQSAARPGRHRRHDQPTLSFRPQRASSSLPTAEFPALTSIGDTVAAATDLNSGNDCGPAAVGGGDGC
ncbi:hypothetical protein [Nocardia sp. N2S4-5]|uniref:hypothetical protein n=1 Tax=Nocardia sp. N2S4-5 TaxID=3351565 RepID=UPI0037CFAB1D